jgi:hypothetical protein
MSSSGKTSVSIACAHSVTIAAACATCASISAGDCFATAATALRAALVTQASVPRKQKVSAGLFLQPQQGAVHLVAREAVAAAHPHDAAALVIAVADAQRLERARQRRLQPPARRVRQQDGKREREALRVVLALHLLLARLRHVWCRS